VAFRYDKYCEQLRNRGVRQYQLLELGHFQEPTQFREVALGWTGAILRRGTTQERDVIDAAIIQNSDPRGLTLSGERTIATTTQTVVTEREGSLDEESASTSSETDIWRYTKTLQDRFVGKDVVPVYKEFPIRVYPPKFGAEVTFRGRKFSAEAGNKKLAKHRSSKKLCEHFGIEIPEF
jgi:hypothetical protein